MYKRQAKEGVLKLTKLSAGGKDLELSGDGKVQMRDLASESTTDLSLKFKINDSYRSKSKLTEALFGAPGSTKGGDVDPVSYTHLDVYKRQHRRITANSHESDQAEVGYFASRDPDVEGKMDLVRREQTPADMDAKRGGVVNVLCEDIDSFDIRYLDPITSQWVETWDTTQALGQQNRLPLEMRITLVMKHVPVGIDATYTTKFMLPMLAPLTFGIPQ